MAPATSSPNPAARSSIRLRPKPSAKFKLLVGTYTAEYGRTGGGIEILTTRSGTNDFHGTWAYNMRRDIWEAAGWSVNQNRQQCPGFRPKDRLNETGGGVGGPVWIPKIYNGRNKTFFYFSNDNDLRPVAPTSDRQHRSHRARDARATSARFRRSSTIRRPLSAPVPRPRARHFPNNIIPTSRFSKISANILPFDPGAHRPALSNNHAFVNTSQVTDHVWAFKIDHDLQRKEPHLVLPIARQPADACRVGFRRAAGNGAGQPVSEAADLPRQSRLHFLAHCPAAQHLWLFHEPCRSGIVPAQTGFASKVGFPGLTGDSDATPVIQFRRRRRVHRRGACSRAK